MRNHPNTRAALVFLILFLCAAAAQRANAQNVNVTLAPGYAVSVPATAIKILEADASLRFLALENKGTTASVCIGPAGVTAATGLCLAPAAGGAPGGTAWFDSRVPSSTLYAISASGTNSLLVIKGN